MKDGDRFCDKCGLPVEESVKAAEEIAEESTPKAPETAAPVAEPVPQYAPPQHASSRAGDGESKLTGILSLIGGIVSIIFCWVPVLMFVPEVLAVVFGIVGIVKKSGKEMAIAGTVMGGIAFMITMWVTMIIALAIFGEFASEIFYIPFY